MRCPPRSTVSKHISPMLYRRSSPSPEFLLVAACCVRPSNPACVRAAASTSLDWERVVRLSALHRVDGLVNSALLKISAPMEAKRELATRAAALARDNLDLAAEALRLDRLFGEAKIPVLFL